jgi:hypothetical protein
MEKDLRIVVSVEEKEARSALERLKQAVTDLKEGAAKGGQKWIQSLADVSAALNLAQQGFSALSAAAQAFYSSAIAQNLELERLVLSSATAIAGTSQVFRDGFEITEPLQKIQALTGEVQKAFDYIREETFKLSGVTSNDVIPLFEVLASKISSVGGGIQDAADLSVKFAAGLSVIGVPLAQARQEINSIISGTIDANSKLAKTLGITNEQVRQWKAQGTVIDEVNSRLQVFLAGNELQAKTLSGIASNIQELAQEFMRLMGAPLVEPLVDGFRRVYELLLANRETLREIATAVGERLGAAFRFVVDLTEQVGTKLGTALQDALAKFDLGKLEQLMVDLGQFAAVAVQGLAEVGSWVIRLTGELLPPLINTVADLVRTTAEGFQGLIDLAAVLSGGLTKQQVDALDAATQLAQEFGKLVNSVVDGSGLAEGSLEQFHTKLEALASQGVLTAQDVEFYNQALERLEQRNQELVSSTGEAEISLRSMQAALLDAQAAAEAYKETVAQVNLQSLEQQLELQQRIAQGELVNAQEIAAARLKIERETTQAILAAAKERLQVLLQDEEGNAKAILEVKTEIAKQELKLAEQIQKEKEAQLQAEVEQIKLVANERQRALEQEQNLLQVRKEAIQDALAAADQEAKVAQAAQALRDQALQSELELARLAVQRAQGTTAIVDATQQLADLQQQAAEAQRQKQLEELERTRELIELRHQGSLVELELQQRSIQSRLEGLQAEIQALKEREQVVGSLSDVERDRLQALEAQAGSLRTSLQLLTENRQQLERQREAELQVLDLRQQQVQALAQQQNTLASLNQLLDQQRAYLDAIRAAQEAQMASARAAIEVQRTLGEADRYRIQALQQQIEILRRQNETLGESEERRRRLGSLEQELARVQAQQAVRQAELAAQQEQIELRRLENQRRILEVQRQQTEELIRRLQLEGQSVEAEQRKLEALRSQTVELGRQIEAQRQVAEEARRTAEQVKQAAAAARDFSSGAQQASQAFGVTTANVADFSAATQQLRSVIQTLGVDFDQIKAKADAAGVSMKDMFALGFAGASPLSEEAKQAQQIFNQLTVSAAKLQGSLMQNIQFTDAYVARVNSLLKVYDDLKARAERLLEVEKNRIPVLREQIQALSQQAGQLQLASELVSAQAKLIDIQIQRAKERGASEAEINALLAQREQKMREAQVLQAKMNELKAQEKVLELEIALARERAINANSKQAALLQQQLEIARQIVATYSQIRQEVESGTRKPTSVSMGTPSLSGGGIPGGNRGSLGIPMARGGPFKAGDLLQVGDNPDGTPNPTTEWIRLSAPGTVLTSAESVKVVDRQQPLPEFNDGRIVAGLGKLQDLLRAALSVPPVSPGMPSVGGMSLRDFVLANT